MSQLRPHHFQEALPAFPSLLSPFKLKFASLLCLLGFSHSSPWIVAISLAVPPLGHELTEGRVSASFREALPMPRMGPGMEMLC